MDHVDEFRVSRASRSQITISIGGRAWVLDESDAIRLANAIHAETAPDRLTTSTIIV